MPKRNWKEKHESAEVVKFERVGTSYEGELLDRKTVKMDDGKDAVLFTFTPGDPKTGDVQDGKVQGFWGSELLTDLMESVDRGVYFRVTFIREKPPTKKGMSPTKLYTVEIAE